MFNTLKAEWTKLTTTKSFWWTTGILFFLVLGGALLQATLTEDNEIGQTFYTSAVVPGFFHMVGLPVLAIQAIMVVTTEYRYRLQASTYMANPKRWQVAIVKLLLSAAIAALLSLIAILLGYAIMEWFGPDGLTENFHPFDDHGKRSLRVYPLAAALLVVFAQGLGLLLRQTAGTIALTLIFFLGIDGFASKIPKIGDNTVNFMPFTAYNNWILEMVPEEAPWGSVAGNLWVFIAWAAVLWILGVVALQSRDV